MQQFFISLGRLCKAGLIRLRDFTKTNLGLLIVVGGYLVPLAIFLIGVKLEWEHAFSPGASGIDNKVLIWVISIPFWILMLTFIGQAVYYRMDTHREVKELKEIYELRLKEQNEGFETRINELKNYSNIFKVIDDVNNKDIYSSTIFGFLIEKMKKDIAAIKDRNFIAEGWYWKLSNKFILHENMAVCSCILNPKQLDEPDIHQYFEEQYKAIEERKFTMERVLIVDSLSELKDYAGFVSEQINKGVDFYILSKEFAELSSITDEIWNNNFKRDFALINANFLIEAKIINDDLKGYEIKAINGSVPLFATNVKQNRKPVSTMVEYFSLGTYNPVKEILAAKAKK